MSGADDPTETWRQHRFVAGQWFYVLPSRLIEALESHVDASKLAPDLWEVEKEAASAAERIGQCVAFHNSHLPITDCYVRPPLPSSEVDPILAAYLKDGQDAGLISPSTDSSMIANATKQIGELRWAEVAYLGWLFTTPLFLTELAEVRARPGVFDAGSIPPRPISFDPAPVPTQSISQAEGGDFRLVQDAQGQADGASTAVRDFCIRWRLAAVIGPRTVIPLSIQFPVALPNRSVAHAETNGALLYIPDIAPLPSRDELRALIESARAATCASAPYIREWFELVEADTQGRKTMMKYERWYAYQHYLRLVYERHSATFSRAIGQLDVAFAKFFGQSEETIRHDRYAISKRLGNKWWLPTIPG